MPKFNLGMAFFIFISIIFSSMNYFEQSTHRLYTSALQESDIERWYAFFEDNDSLDYLGLDLSKPAEELAEGWIRAQFDRYKNSGFGHLAIRRREDDVVLCWSSDGCRVWTSDPNTSSHKGPRFCVEDK